MKESKEIEIFEEMKEKEENFIDHKRNKKKKKSIFKRIFIFIYISSLILTIIFSIIRAKTAFIIFLSISIVISACLLLRFIIIKIRNCIKERERLLKEDEERKKKEKEERKKKEKEERKRKKKEIIDRQFALNKSDEGKKTEDVKKVLEDMCALGSIMKEEILEEKKKEPEKFISIEEAIKEENKDEGKFCLGILAQNLEKMGITTAIEKNAPNDIDSINASNTVLQFITNGMIEKPKYDLHFDLGDERNNELLNNKEEQEKFNNKLKKKLSLEHNIPEDQIIITNAQRGSYRVQVIFQTEQFNKTIDINEFKSKCSNSEFKELKCLKEINKGLIMDGCKLNSNILDARGNRESGWGQNEKRGGFKYNPPKGWKGYGLKVMDVYDGGNNDWLAFNGNPNEWAVAYHGIGCKLGGTVEFATKEIFYKGFQFTKRGQAYKAYKNDNPKYRCKDKQNDHSQLVGEGVYCSPDPKVMEEYAGYASKKANANGKNYLMGFMMRVKPDKIRYSNSKYNYWVLNGTKDEMRPYRIMVKEY